MISGRDQRRTGTTGREVKRGRKIKRQCGVSHKASREIVAEPRSVRKARNVRS